MFDLESRLIKKIKKGNRKAANDLIEKYYKEIYAYIYKKVSEKQLAMDLTQEVFISMLKTIGNFDSSKSTFKNWLCRIATYKVIDYYRSRKYTEISLTVNIDDFDIEDKTDLEGKFELKEIMFNIEKILQKADALVQEIFRLKLYGGYTFSDISKVLNLNESTVKSKYYSVIKKIKKEMKSYE